MTDRNVDGPDAAAKVAKVVISARRAGLPWSPARQQRVSWAVMSRIETVRRRRPLIALCLTGAVAAAVCLLVWQQRQPAPTGGTTAATGGTTAATALGPAPAAPDWQLASTLADGTRVVRDDASTVLRKTVESTDDVRFDLDSGGARFEVARRPSRVFRVHAGEVTVQVIGTGFRVRRTEARCQVAVEHGRVLVSWWGGSRELGAGEQGMFPPEAPTAGAPVAAASPISVTGHVARRTAASAAVGPEALFAEADRARAEGKPELAVETLRELGARFPHDPHAGAAAFTLGRLLLESLQKPREAARAFAEARALARGDSTLGEDALAREVEALHAAGDAAGARARAELYRSLFPHGLMLQIVERYGELKADP
jgi:transmembrane sensor